MNIKRGEIWWADLDEPRGSEPGYKRPVVIIQSDAFNKSKIQTIIAAVITSNMELVKAPGNIKLPNIKSVGLKKESVINISQLITLDKHYLTERAGKLTAKKIQELNDSLKLILNI